MYRDIICFWSVPLALSVGSHNIKYSPLNSLTTRALSETQGTLCLAMNIGFTSLDTSALRTTAIDLKKIHFNVRWVVTGCQCVCLVCNWGYRANFCQTVGLHWCSTRIDTAVRFLFNKTNRRTNFSKIIFVKKLYMFRAVLLPVIRSFPLYIRHWYVSCQFDNSFQARPSWTCLKAVIRLACHIPVPNVQWKTPDYWQKKCPKHVEFLDKNKFGKISASGWLFEKEICYDARSYERKKLFSGLTKTSFSQNIIYSIM